MADAEQEALRLWTVQPWALWEQLAEKGTLTVDPQHLGLHASYDWLREQLDRRLPGHAGHYPWWAYCLRPDLRRTRHQKPREERFALLELQRPRSGVLLFPAWAWDLIFYGSYLSLDPSESRAWQRRLREAVPDEEWPWPLPQPWQAELEASWERLFDPGLPGWGPDQPKASPIPPQEAVFEVLDRDHVQRVTSFFGARPSERPSSPVGSP